MSPIGLKREDKGLKREDKAMTESPPLKRWAELHVSINKPRHQTNIKDPIHGYVTLNLLERLIVSTPQFQRLRGVLQNGTASYTYPSTTTSRFVHSLGVMKLEGEMLLPS